MGSVRTVAEVWQLRGGEVCHESPDPGPPGEPAGEGWGGIAGAGAGGGVGGVVVVN